MGGAASHGAFCFRGTGDAGGNCFLRRKEFCTVSFLAAARVFYILGLWCHRRHEQEEEAVLGHARPSRLRAGAGPRVRPGAGRALRERAWVGALADGDGGREQGWFGVSPILVGRTARWIRADPREVVCPEVAGQLELVRRL